MMRDNMPATGTHSSYKPAFIALFAMSLAAILFALMRGPGVLLLTLSLLLLCTPYISQKLLNLLMPPYRELIGSEADVVVILAAGVSAEAAELHGLPSLTWMTLERMRHGAWLSRKLCKPIMVSGGDPAGHGISEGRLVADALEREFKISVQWIDEVSRSTRENAKETARFLKNKGLQRVFLVSHAWHLRRAAREFEKAGIKVVPAGFSYLKISLRPGNLVPNLMGIQNLFFFIYEVAATSWYAVVSI